MTPLFFYANNGKVFKIYHLRTGDQFCIVVLLTSYNSRLWTYYYHLFPVKTVQLTHEGYLHVVTSKPRRLLVATTLNIPPVGHW